MLLMEQAVSHGAKTDNIREASVTNTRPALHTKVSLPATVGAYQILTRPLIC